MLGDWDAAQLDRQCRRFAKALRLGTADTRSDHNLAAQREHYATAAGQTRVLEQQAKQVLMRHGVPPIWFMRYYNFVRSLAKAGRQCGSRELALEAEVAVVRWSGRGCIREILVEVVLQVFKVRLQPDAPEQAQSDEAMRAAGPESRGAVPPQNRNRRHALRRRSRWSLTTQPHEVREREATCCLG
jgi:hypothetical protein